MDYVDDPNGERNCNSRWDHQFERAVKVDGVIMCVACYTGTRTPEIPVPGIGQPMPVAPPKDAELPAAPTPAPVPEEPKTEPIQSDSTETVETD